MIIIFRFWVEHKKQVFTCANTKNFILKWWNRDRNSKVSAFNCINYKWMLFETKIANLQNYLQLQTIIYHLTRVEYSSHQTLPALSSKVIRIELSSTD